MLPKSAKKKQFFFLFIYSFKFFLGRGLFIHGKSIKRPAPMAKWSKASGLSPLPRLSPSQGTCDLGLDAGFRRFLQFSYDFLAPLSTG